MQYCQQFAFFSVCSREGFGGSTPPTYRHRSAPIQDKLKRLFEFAEQASIRTLSTQCVGRASPELGKSCDPYALMLPLHQESSSWQNELSQKREIFVERPRYGSPEENRRMGSADMFGSNPNVVKLIEQIDAHEWIVFGIAMQACVTYAVRGLLASGKMVTILQDTVLPASRSESTLEQSLETMQREGVSLETAEAFLLRAAALCER